VVSAPLLQHNISAAAKFRALAQLRYAMAFSSEVEPGSSEENASKQYLGASVLIQCEPTTLYTG
jgi:hypothetical protein